MESILNLRENEEKDTMENLVKVQNELETQKSILRDLIMAEEEARKNKSKCDDIHQLRHQNLYKEKLEEEIQRQDKLIDTISLKFEEARLELIEAQKNRKVMEKLKEKDMEEYIADLRYVEQKELDEMAILKYTQLMGF